MMETMAPGFPLGGPGMPRADSVPAVFDHVTIRVTDRELSERFYSTVLIPLGIEKSYRTSTFSEWQDFSLTRADRAEPPTRRLHVGFAAPTIAQVDEFHRAGIEAGYEDDGAPGPRPQYGEDYYGAFLRDPDGNSVEAVNHGGMRRGGVIDHVWIRVADLASAKRFYATIAPHAGLRVVHDEPDRVQLSGPDYSFSLVQDERPLTEHVHLAFPAREDATVRAFHAAALAAGYEDHGAPGERTVYHPGYYGAFVLDPDGNNVEVVNHNRG